MPETSSSAIFWSDGGSGLTWIGYGYTICALILIFAWHVLRSSRFRLRFPCRPSDALEAVAENPAVSLNGLPQSRISTVVSDLDLKDLIYNLDEKNYETEKWEHVIDRRNSSLSYTAVCCKPKDGPLKYLSTTVFESCSAEMLRDFYMDNNYRKMWDKTLIDHEQLQMDNSGVEIGRIIKKFPLLTPREYVLAWRMWEGKDRSFCYYGKECEHPLAPRHKKYVRVGLYRSGWRIRKVPGRNACEIKMVHQEDARLNVEMGKLAFARGIWSYICKMDNALRKYSIKHPSPAPTVSAITLMKKVPDGLDDLKSTSSANHHETSKGNAICHQEQCSIGKLSKKPSSKSIAKGLILLGSAIYLSRGHSNLGAKVAMAYILTKFTKNKASSTQNRNSQASSHKM